MAEATLKIAPNMALRLAEAIITVAGGRAGRVALPGHFIVSREGSEVAVQILNLSQPEPAS